MNSTKTKLVYLLYERHGFNKAKTARALSCTPTAVAYHIKKYKPEKITYTDFIEVLEAVDHDLDNPIQRGQDLRLAFFEEFGIYPEVIHRTFKKKHDRINS